MFKKSSKGLQKQFEDFRLSYGNSNQKGPNKIHRTRFSHSEKVGLLRKSFQQSLSSQKNAQKMNKKFNDYGFNSKAILKKPQNSNPRRGFRSPHKETLSIKSKQISEKNLQKHRKDYTHRKIVQRSQEHLRLGKERKTEPHFPMNEHPENSPRESYSSRWRKVKPHLINSSTECDQSESRNFLAQKVKILEKSMNEYYQLYTKTQQKLEEYKNKTKQQQKKCQIIRELYRQKLETLLMNQKQVNKKNIFGHLFTYKQFPKDFVPQQIITELSRELEFYEDNGQVASECSSLSLLSR